MARGWRRFTKERLSSADVNDYLMNQVTAQFASAAARDAAIQAPVNGQEAWLDSEGRKTRYEDGVWVPLNDRYADSSGTGVWNENVNITDQSEVVLASQTIDRPYPYVLELQAQLIAAASTGAEFHARIRLGAVNGMVLSPDAVRSGQFPNGEGMSLTIARCDSPRLIGPATVVVTGRKVTAAAGWWTVYGAGNLFSIGIRPVA